MTGNERALVQALACCTYTPGSTEKRFVRWAASRDASYEFSAKATAFLQRLAHSYRRQLGRCMADDCTKCEAA